MDIAEAIRTRKSIRDFKPDPVPKKVLRKILEIAARAPSAENSQPWEFTVIAGEVLDNVRQANIEKLHAGAPYHPDLHNEGWPKGSIYRQRQVEIAKQIFQLMEIAREDKEKRMHWMERGFRYFNAPAAIIISADQLVHYPRPLFDIGTVTQNICLAALQYGLGTCILNQGISYPEVLNKLAGIPASKRIMISIALGYPNWDFPANKVVSTREAVENITTWCGFE
ncbi:MAG: nitroreductase [Desulfobacterales bacterium PC51MH44]|nr:MAG: nitroreductase [Desulfobacterales bacterium PC51MH44]